MRIAVPAEKDPAEHRVAATPETVKRFKALDAEVAIEAGAGKASGFLDEAYEAMGATIVHSAEERSARPTWCCACAGPRPRTSMG